MTMVVLFVSVEFVKVGGWKRGGKRGTDEHVKLANRLQKVCSGLPLEDWKRRSKTNGWRTISHQPLRGLQRNQLLRNRCHSMPRSLEEDDDLVLRMYR